ncbi:G-patch domain-containing protein [Phascolomyces articulosus]|uniref:G-patch domain-containing protein n=1 Tax=Phascolomyces articulosus TaxID=60185 RepID=A0AAD5P6T5_9FUNG|nr:G-patch domain-containing protein [Phascolomyces articulosus]
MQHLSDDQEEQQEEFSLPRNSQPTGYVDYDAMEQATMESHIPESNMGYRLLQKMGWKAGQGLGSNGQGRIDPIRIDIKEDVLGVGKAEEEAAYHVSSTAKRKIMGSEKQLEETTEERMLRETKVKEHEMVQEELREVKRAFYCELCDKQYSKIAEYEQHLQSYDHHHKKRFRDMKEQSRKSEFAQSAKDKKRERERRREEKELKRMQEAMLKRAGNAQAGQTSNTSLPAVTTNANSSSGGGGWSSVGKSTPPSTIIPSSKTVGSITSSSSGGWATMTTTSPMTNTKSPVVTTPASSSSDHKHNETKSETTEKKPATKLTFGLPQKKSTGFRFNLKKN